MRHKALPVQNSRFFPRDAWSLPPSGPSKPPKHQLKASILIRTQRRKTQPTSFSMPRNRDIVKAASLRREKSKAKVIEWETRAHSRGIRDVPVEVSAMKSQQKPRKKAGRRPRAEGNNTSRGESAPQPMDVDETFCAEELVIPASEMRVRQPACASPANLTHLPAPAQLR
jgi:hypothetical protein